MSMPVGQSRAQPLQDRHRSSASSTAGSSKPSTPIGDVLEHVGAPAGGVLLVPGGEVATGTSPRPRPVLSAMHLPTPVHRCTAPENDPASWVSRSVVRRGRGGVARRRSASNGAGSTSTPGLSRLSGSRIRLACSISAIACGRVHPRQQLGAGPAVAVLARHRPAVRRDQVGGLLDELAEPPAAAGVLELEVDAHVHAAVAEVAVGHAVERVLLQQGVEVAQVGAQLRRAAPRRPPSPPAQAGSASGRRGRRRPRGSATARAARRCR